MAHVKILTPTELPLSDLLGPLPRDGDLRKFPDNSYTDSTSLLLSHLCGRLDEGVRASAKDVSLVLPPGLMDTIADNVVQLAKDEPCGLRGSVLRVKLVEEWPRGQEALLVEVKADPSTPTTHILEVTLRPDPVSWYTKMAHIFRSLTKRRVVVSPKYELHKTTIYNFNDC